MSARPSAGTEEEEAAGPSAPPAAAAALAAASASATCLRAPDGKPWRPVTECLSSVGPIVVVFSPRFFYRAIVTKKTRKK